MTPNPAAPQAPQKKGMSGCLVVLLVLGGLLGVACLVGGFFTWRATQSETGRKVFAAMGKGVEMATKGMNAPGAEELREAGCPQAMVMDVGEMVDAFSELFDAGESIKKSKKSVGLMALCQGTVLDELPDCDTLAAVYVKAVHPTESFSVSVRTQGNNKPRCTKRYSAAGTTELDVEGE